MTNTSQIDVLGKASASHSPRRELGVEWRDVAVGFGLNGKTGDVSTVDGDAAIRQNLKNLFHLSKYDKLFHPEIYVGLVDLIFDQWSDQVAKLARDQIISAVAQWEPRISLKKVEVDWRDADQSVEIEITYTHANSDVEVTFRTTLKRLR